MHNHWVRPELYEPCHEKTWLWHMRTTKAQIRLHGFHPQVRQGSFVEIGHEIISMAILFLRLIEVGQLSVTGERICT